MLDESKSSTAFLITGVISALHISLDQIRSDSSWFEELIMHAHLNRRSEENMVVDDDNAVIFALRYQAFRFKRVSKELELVDFDTKHNEVGKTAKIRQGTFPSSWMYAGATLGARILLSGIPRALTMKQKEHARISAGVKSSEGRDTRQSGQGKHV